MSTRKKARRPVPPPKSRSRPDEPVVVRVGRSADLVAALPPMLGFHPEESVVVIGIHERDGRGRLGGMVRIDLAESPDAETDGVLAEAARERLERSAPAKVVVVVVSGVAGTAAAPPHLELVDAITATFEAIDIPVMEAVWAERIAIGAPWRCYHPCACSGTLPDPGGTVAAAAHAAVTGRVTRGSREEVEASLAPDPEAGGERRRRLIDDWHQVAVDEWLDDRRASSRRNLEFVRGVVGDVGAGTPLSESDIARLAVALCDPAVRDTCLGWAAGHDDRVDPVHAERLWTLLTRAVPAPEVAQPATLLAFATVDQGGGAVLTTALQRACDADPHHQLSRMLGTLITAGFPPETVRELVSAAYTETTAKLAA
ncbi:DUF4192 domain-containing protein [Actinomycetospora atypica]|uniref:DUF4192 domain-containing protein n=1 Tax=Actinomycetospora atypica TaxID=1290095 RepID=A0ABV9YND5_9PSEU